METKISRVQLKEPGPMLPPVPAVLISSKGMDGNPDELSVLWTFITSGKPAQIGVTADKGEHVIHDIILKHKEFVINVMTKEYILPFDTIDMSSSKIADKFSLSGFTRGTAKTVNAPTVEEAAIHLECRVTQSIDLPPTRTLFLADVLATRVKEGVCDAQDRLIVDGTAFFGMTAGSGEFYTMGKKVGHIGQTKQRTDIKY